VSTTTLFAIDPELLESNALVVEIEKRGVPQGMFAWRGCLQDHVAPLEVLAIPESPSELLIFCAKGSCAASWSRFRVSDADDARRPEVATVCAKLHMDELFTFACTTCMHDLFGRRDDVPDAVTLGGVRARRDRTRLLELAQQVAGVLAKAPLPIVNVYVQPRLTAEVVVPSTRKEIKVKTDPAGEIVGYEIGPVRG
jgi:hypothetical protein